MASRDHTRRDRGVHALADLEILTGISVALDASFVVRALHSREGDHAECLDLMQRLVTAEATVIFSELLAVELVETAYKLAVVERHGRRAWPSGRLDGRFRRRASRLSNDLMGLGLSAYESVHVSAALSAGARVIATTDHGFSRVPEAVLQVATTSSRVGSYRRARAGIGTS